MKRLTVWLLLLLGSLLPALRAAEPAMHLDDPARLLPADAAWTKSLDAKLDAFEHAAGIKVLIQIHPKSPAAEEDKEPGDYMRALATKLGVIKHGVLMVYFADDPDWRVWIGDELTPAFTGQAGTAKEFTESGAMHEAKEAFVKAMFAKADAAFAALPKGTPGQHIALQADALTDGLIGKFGSQSAATAVIPLWPEGVPGLRADAGPEHDDGKGHYTNIHYPTLVVYPPAAGTANGTAVIYAPGGGYQRVASGVNGGIVTSWLNSLGITVYMLKYRHAPYGEPAPLQDALRAVRLLRSRAAELGIKHLGMLGGSAGGHLTASAGTLFDAPEGRTGAELDKVSGRPDFMVLIFPEISMRGAPLGRFGLLTDELRHRYSVDEQVTKDTTPAFLVHSAEDRALVEGSVLFSTAMRRAGAPMELHIYAKGPHGDGMSPALGPISEWPKLCEKWMRFNGWLPGLSLSNPSATKQ